jgi:MFS family permease
MTEARRLGVRYRKLFAATTISNLGDGVSLIAYPWLASAITRNPLLIALVAVVQRLPWLLFTLPAGVIVDRNDRRRLMVLANTARFVLTGVVALAVFVRRDTLPAPDAVDTVVGTDTGLYLVLIAATLFLGIGEVLYDNSAQTFLPSIVSDDQLERANGRMYSAEMVANQFAGPPLAGLLLAIGFALPFVVDAGSFGASAALIASIAVARRPPPADAPAKPQWRAEIGEGFRWLWRHPVLRTMAISLAVLNMCSNMGFALLVIYAQDVLGTSTTEFAILSTIIALGGVIGGWAAPALIARFGSGRTLLLTVVAQGGSAIVAGLLSSWLLVGAALAVGVMLGMAWNVITVSFRQSIIPDRLLGRVNSVYRFFGWGAIPIGALLGGLIVEVLDGPLSHAAALRAPLIISGLVVFVLIVPVGRTLTTERLQAIRAAGRTEAGTEPTPSAVDPAAR